jgi:hypothetical protein
VAHTDDVIAGSSRSDSDRRLIAGDLKVDMVFGHAHHIVSMSISFDYKQIAVNPQVKKPYSSVLTVSIRKHS